MSNQMSNHIMSENTQRSTGRDAQRNNIAAAKAVAQTIRTTLGPKGMDKMIVDSTDEVIITNDGVTILREMQIEHPAAKMVVEIAKTQEDTVGDGTTTAVIIAGELLKKAEDLLDQNIHPTIVARGYRIAEQEAQNILNQIAEDISIKDEIKLKQLAITAMTGKGAESNKEKLAEIIVKAIKFVSETKPILNNQTNQLTSQTKVNKDNIKVEKVVGYTSDKSELIEGIVIDKEKVHPSMPNKIENAKVALLDSPLEIKNTEIDAKIQITDPQQLNAFLAQEEQSLKEMVTKIKSTNANVLLCQKGIDDVAQHFLAKEDIMAFRRVKRSDLEKISQATGAKIVSSWKELEEKDLGYAGQVKTEKINDENITFIEKCKNPKAITLLVKGGTEHVAEEIKRAVIDAIGDLSSALSNGKIVAGAAAVEMELAKKLRYFANSLNGREQLAVLAFAETMEIIPRTLAENAGLDPIDVITQLRTSHNQGEKWIGINVFSGKNINAWEEGIIEPLKIKTQALSSATEVAEMILRIDDVILGNEKINS
ncbi:thermosome subunit [archaeon]|jgi:archaeal chaperonin|nr:thermosome subunit [archaeon]MBT6869018.1 thermosome subunit [archaeon]MBT7193606.1 thermosome subunit [archaeon]MBT7380139.1 thermosome subunit [archaeon]MBT7507457.1 thermosome subunit [archaeon]